MQDRVTIGLVQWHAVPGDPAANLDTALALVAEAAGQGADLVVLPELWASGYDAPRLGAIVAAAAEPVPGPRSDRLAEAARTYGIWLFAGSVPELADGVTYNTTVVYGPDGAVAGRHRKAHLYRPTAEDAVFAAGDEASVVDTDRFGRIGMATCFDGDHAGYARALRERGARVVVMPAAYEAGAERWWDLLHPANALANGQWWITVNQAGGEGDAAMFGRSRVIAPDGTVVCEAPRHDAGGPNVVTCTVDLAAGIADADTHSSALWTDTRPELY
ncbi:carbon-nitrogen hydrolase family protein [Streptomyces antnestii]|uniref:Carbon-nitrogen hydrolase family protein n=1 Tax=Streptomyces antnestii TaxID=2494256 RepID=A0A437PLA3_9ACTN|nr:carbon-nitrogen hydrolase family protein [Streptomyces sp. San01]RVU23060.1 carbon-nitrogen hydrolase family protein [Streptomyces sp. San01]